MIRLTIRLSRRGVAVIQRQTGRYLLFTIYYLYYLPFTIYHLPFTIYYLLFTIYHLLFDYL